MAEKARTPTSSSEICPQISFAPSLESGELVEKWWFWWRGYRLLKECIARVLRRFDRSGRWYLLVHVAPHSGARTTRKASLCRATQGSPVWRYVKNRVILWDRTNRPSYSFRIRFNRCEGIALETDAVEIVVSEFASGQQAILTSADKKSLVKDSLVLVLKSDGWPTEELARAHGERAVFALRRSLAKLKLGVNFGEFGGGSWMFDAGLLFFEERTGERVLNDTHGLMVYETFPEPLFVKPTMRAVLGKPEIRFRSAFQNAIAINKGLNDQERLAFDLFNSSYFQSTVNTRFVLLIMAIEALLDPVDRPQNCTSHLRHLIDLTEEEPTLSQDETRSICSSLQFLLKESIRQSGRRFCTRVLGDRIYDGKVAGDFFAICYDLRSNVVHGRDAKSYQNVRRLVATLEAFVSDILSVPLGLGDE